MIFRVPVDNQHFRDTIAEGKPLSEVMEFLSPEDKNKLQRTTDGEIVRFWGSIPGEANKRNFEKMKVGDEVLCYRSGKYIALAKVAFKTTNRDLAAASWGLTEVGKTWELIYFFDSVTLFEIDSSAINLAFGFSEGPVMGFSALSEERANTFIQKHGSVKKFIESIAKDKEADTHILEEVQKIKIESPFEAQFYLVDLGNQLGFDTYVPVSDAGRTAFGKKLSELITVRKVDLSQFVAPIILDPLSNIDVVWFKENYRPQFFYEVIHRSGMNEAFARLKAVSEHYETAKTRIIGTEETGNEFERARRLYYPNSEKISYKPYEELVKVHAETIYHKDLVSSFLD